MTPVIQSPTYSEMAYRAVDQTVQLATGVTAVVAGVGLCGLSLVTTIFTVCRGKYACPTQNTIGECINDNAKVILGEALGGGVLIVYGSKKTVRELKNIQTNFQSYLKKTQ